MHEEEIKKFKTRIYIIIPIFSPPFNIRMTHVGVEGGVLPIALSKLYAKMASIVGSSFDIG